jgi:SAM-dependent methyltransferase
LLAVRQQAWAWSAGYAVLIALVVATGLARRDANAAPNSEAGRSEAIPLRRVLHWIALSAVPSGLMLSTTTHLTTDVFAMPLLWVIPLGLYLLSFVVAFADRRALAATVSRAAPIILLLGGGLAMISRTAGSISLALVSVVLLFVVAVTLHARLYELRPPPERLTFFYLVMSAGGVLGGAFTALAAPLWFDWVWEHPLLVIAAALLVPQRPLLGWMKMDGLSREMTSLAVAALVVFAVFLGWLLYRLDPAEDNLTILLLALGLAFCGVLVLGYRSAFVAVLAVTMLARGGIETAQTSLSGARSRSYFGIYTVRDYPDAHQRMLAHGTTLHGMQYTDARRRMPTTYYGPTSGVGIAMTRAPALFGPAARIGVVGLGTGTLACWHKPGQRWTVFEIDQAVLALSRQRKFTFLPDCAPDATVRIGDARLELAKQPPGSFDLLAIDAFSSDAIPLHLLTSEALDVYGRALAPDGLLLIHISNRYFELEPQLAASLRRRGWAARVLTDRPEAQGLSASVWVGVARNEARLAALTSGRDDWAHLLTDPTTRPWTDDHASILPAVRWGNLLGKVF